MIYLVKNNLEECYEDSNISLSDPEMGDLSLEKDIIVPDIIQASGVQNHEKQI